LSELWKRNRNTDLSAAGFNGCRHTDTTKNNQRTSIGTRANGQNQKKKKDSASWGHTLQRMFVVYW